MFDENLTTRYMETYLACQWKRKRSEYSGKGHGLVEGRENIYFHLRVYHFGHIYSLFLYDFIFLNILLCTSLYLKDACKSPV